MLSDAFRAAVESWDRDALTEALAPGVVFRSPAVFRPYEGRETTLVVLEAVSNVFEDFRYLEGLEGEEGEVLHFEARVGDRELDGIDLLRFDDAGLVRDLTVMIRPLSGLTALVEAMGRELEKLGVPVPGGG
ncbi:MAG: nuclear transport factor 2 family protein [Solirubrobacterales bacterium]